MADNYKVESCEAVADEDLFDGDIAFVLDGRAVKANDWTGASGVLWRVIHAAKAGQPIRVMTIKKP